MLNKNIFGMGEVAVLLKNSGGQGGDCRVIPVIAAMPFG